MASVPVAAGDSDFFAELIEHEMFFEDDYPLTHRSARIDDGEARTERVGTARDSWAVGALVSGDRSFEALGGDGEH